MKRITPVFVTLALALTVWSCGGSSTLDNTEAAVYLTVDVSELVKAEGAVTCCSLLFDN